MNIKTILKNIVAGICGAALLTMPAYASHNMGGGGSTVSASLSTDTINIIVGENGSWTISGNDGGAQREFRWSLPSGLSICGVEE